MRSFVLEHATDDEAAGTAADAAAYAEEAAAALHPISHPHPPSFPRAPLAPPATPVASQPPRHRRHVARARAPACAIERIFTLVNVRLKCVEVLGLAR